VIGPNGAGKTTLFRMITGDEAPDEGDFSVGDTVKLGYVDQSRDALDDKQTVWQVISDGMEEIELGKRTMQSRAYVGQFNFKGGDQQKTVGQLSGGERNRVHLAPFRLPPGGIVGVIGPNGAGKTTLFRMITGDEVADGGDFSVGDTVKLGYVDQSRDALDDKQTVWQVISDGMEEIELGKRTMQSRAYVGQFNFKGGDQQKTVGQLSGGERNRVHLARMLKSGANLLLLDEPTNDLDVDTLRALEEALLEFAGCAVVVSHDRWFLDRIATHILAFEGNSHVEWFEGNYEAYEGDKKRRLGADADRPTRIKYKPISR